MGRTFRKDKSFRPKGRGQIFSKDPQPWKRPDRQKDVERDSDRQQPKFEP